MSTKERKADPSALQLQEAVEQLQHADLLRDSQPQVGFWHVVKAVEMILQQAVEDLELDVGPRPTLGRYVHALTNRGVLPKALRSDLERLVRNRNLLAHSGLEPSHKLDFSIDFGTANTCATWYRTRLDNEFRSEHGAPTTLPATSVEPVDPRSRTVFICHAKEDADRAAAIYETLTDRGHRPWMDKHDLLPGQDWDREIRRAIRKSDFFLACISKTSVSKRGYVQKEVRFALDVLGEIPPGQIFLIPIRLESCSIPAEIEHLHWIDLNDDLANISRVFEAVEFRSHKPSG